MATEVVGGTPELIDRCTAMIADLLRLPTHNMWIDYDEEADVLYLSFRRPQRATHTTEVDGDILLRTDGGDVVGVTILNASMKQ